MHFCIKTQPGSFGLMALMHGQRLKYLSQNGPLMSFCLHYKNGIRLVKHGEEGEKVMKRTNYLDLITSIDVLNTVNGGVSEPQLNLIHYEDYREIRLRVPGISLEDVHVEVHNNNLSVFYFINIASGDKMVQLPRFVYNRNVPYYIDISKIQARLEEDELVVNLPFNKLANGYHKEIKTSDA